MHTQRISSHLLLGLWASHDAQNIFLGGAVVVALFSHFRPIQSPLEVQAF